MTTGDIDSQQPNDPSGDNPDREEAIKKAGYLLLEKIGESTFGKVYKAKHLKTGTIVAIKEFKEKYEGNLAPLSPERIAKSEYELGKSLKHHNIIEVTEFFEANGTSYIVMPLASDTLKGMLEQRGKLPWAKALGPTIEICEGVAYIHLKGIVHLDLKPSNILILDYLMKICDFGIAHSLEETKNEGPGFTDVAPTIGSAGYRAPEVEKGVRDKPQSDVYSLGVNFLSNAGRSGQ